MKEIKNLADYQTLLNTHKPILLDFYADWCGPCQALLPTVEKLADKHADDAIIAKVNVDTNPELSQHFGVRSIPALFFLKNGQVQDSFVGLQSEAALDTKIQQYISEAA